MIKNAHNSDFCMIYEYPEANTRDSVSFKCGRDVTLREQLYNEGTTPLWAWTCHDVEIAKLRRWNLELVLCVMKSVFSKFPFV